MMMRSSFLTAMLSAMLATGWAQPGQVDSPDETAPAPTVTIDGKQVSDEELTSFSLLLETTEGRGPAQRIELVEEYILTQLHRELKTTVPMEATDSTSPYKYSSMGQRQILKSAMQREVAKNIKVPRSDMEAWYKTNQSKYVTPARVKAYHLFMETSRDEPSSAPDKVRARIVKVKADADKGTSFGLLASKNSEASSAKFGGEIGYITPQMPIGPQNKPMNIVLENTLFSLDPGKVSDVVQTSHGLHLLYISEKSTTQTPTLDDLVTSGILPGAVSNEHVTSEIKRLIAETTKKHNGELANTSGTQDQLTTKTPAFKFDGKTYTIADMENLYGARFTRFYQRAQGNPAALQDLLKQGMEDEALVLAAVDAGLDKSPENTTQLDMVGKRAAAVKHIQKIIAEQYPVLAERAQQIYEEQKEQTRQPEAEGEILVAKAKDAASPADAGRYRELAQKQATAARELLKQNESFESVAKKVATRDVETTTGRVARHVSGQATDLLGRAFDQATAGAKENEISEVSPVGNDSAVAKLVKRYPGEPVPFERVRGRLMQQAQMENDRRARKDLVRQLQDNGRVKITTNESTGTATTGQTSR
ncbi:MAG: peptidylprolyl isomerase [Candidatus Sumerlaeaceae bacterium]